jgi:ABC-type cobalamin/Fe3+-siderophores transport system ATPase subunit
VITGRLAFEVFVNDKSELVMIQRLYVHNFKCLENFELRTPDLPSMLLIGKNGVGKSAVCLALEIFQNIGRGTNRVGQLVKTKDFTRNNSAIPMRFEIELLLNATAYKYSISFESADKLKELSILDEQLLIAGEPVYSRERARVTLYDSDHNQEAQFMVDWHLVALPVIQRQSDNDPLQLFKTWLSRMIILSPIPCVMTGESADETLEPTRTGENFGEWFSGLLTRYPAAYTEIHAYLRDVMPDILDIQNDAAGKNHKVMSVRFKEHNAQISIYFNDLSDGEKCFLLCAVLLAANTSYGPVFCFWDEPDNYLSLSEVGYFLSSLRRSFENGGQLWATSHNPEAIRKFSNENTFFIDRKSHLEPTLIRPLEEMDLAGDLIESLLNDDLEI